MEKYSRRTQFPLWLPGYASSRSDDVVSILASSRVALEGGISSATLIISRETGKILVIYPSILPRSLFLSSNPYHDYTPHVLMPGLVDTHVHVNEPGRTSTEGFFTATRAAIFGGVTTIIDMPLNSIPATTTVAALNEKIKAAKDKCWCDVGFLGGLIPGNEKELNPLVDAGVRGFKAFLIASGVPEFPPVSYADVRAAMTELATSPTMLMFHAEKIPSQIPDFERLRQDPAFLYPNDDHELIHVYNNFLTSRPPVFEDEAIKMLIDLSKFAPNLPLHVAHVSTAEALPILRKAQEKGVNISAETCFHYLALAAEEVPLSDTRFKSEPPIRSKANQDELWKALRRLARGDDSQDQDQNQEKILPTTRKPPKKDLRLGPITAIVSDHSPCSPEAKLLPSYIPPHPQPGSGGYHDAAVSAERGDFFKAWGGIASVGLGLPVLWTAFHERGWNVDSAAGSRLVEYDGGGYGDDDDNTTALNAALTDVVNWCCRNPAELVGLGTQKGRLKVGYDADVCVFDPEAEWVLEEDDLLFRHKMSPYEGRTLRGRVVATWLRGGMMWSLDGGFTGTVPEGELLLEQRKPEKPDTCNIEGDEAGGGIRMCWSDWIQWLWNAATLTASGCLGREPENSTPARNFI